MDEPSGKEATNQIPGASGSAQPALVAGFKRFSPSLNYRFGGFGKRIYHCHGS
jgi:hypothetical protein